jgi:hypothetical protein
MMTSSKKFTQARALMSLGWLILFHILSSGAEEPKPAIPLLRAHAHNDYEHPRPLFDALDYGFCSIEADVWLVSGQLLVAHDLKDAKPSRTLEALYLHPLKARVEQNGGRVFRAGPSITLLIDVKSEATNTYSALRQVLKRYESILTHFHANRTETNAVTVIVSGNRARELMASEPSRLAAYDGRLEDLDSHASPHFIPLVSDTASRLSKWKGGPDDGPFPVEDRKKLESIVQKAHRQGRRIRFWGAPDTPMVWREFFSAHVDLLNADDLAALQKFLLASSRP